MITKSGNPGLRRRLWEWLCLLAVVILVAMLMVSARVTASTLLRNAEQERLQLLASLLADDIETDLASINAALESVIKDYFSQAATPALLDQASHRMAALAGAVRGARAIGVIDRHGVLVAGSKTGLLGASFAQRDYFNTVRQSANPATLYISAPFHAAGDDLVMTVSRMVPDAGGGFGGVIVATLDQGYFRDKFRTAVYAPDVWALVIHGGGTQFLNFPTRPAIDGNNLDRPGTFFRRHLDGGHAASLLGGVLLPDGERRTMALRSIASSRLAMDRPIVLGISRLESAIVQPLRRQQLSIVAACCALALAGALALAWLQRRRAQGERLHAAQLRGSRDLQVLADSEARFRTLIEDAPLAIAILRAGHFIYTNPRYRALHGYGVADDLAGRPWRAMIAAQSHAVMARHAALIDADSSDEQQFEVLGLGKDAHLVPIFKTTARVMLLDGAATMIVAQDVSVQKQAEALMLLARDAAESANRSKTDFLANMSHEIRSPLNAILGLAYLLERARLEPDARDMVRKIRGSGQSLLGIVNDILDMSKIDAGHLVLEQLPFELADVIDRVGTSMGMAGADKPIELVIHPPPPGVATLLGDALRLQQVLVNLTGNAIKFTHAGQVELRTVLERRDDDGVVLRFCVSDTGPGIAAELHETIFSAFAQADTSTTRRFGGTGLGLTICRQLVQLMGGQLTLRSVLGQGSEFSFTVPLVVLHPATVSSPDMLGISVLIADDSEIALSAAGATASQLGWEVRAVPSGEAALAYLHHCAPSQLPGVVLLDWQMPGLDGLATARALRAFVSAEVCPIVLMSTAFSLADLALQPGADQVDAILSKPVTASTLYNAVMDARRLQRGVARNAVAPPLRAPSVDLAGITVLVVDDSDINREVVTRILHEHGARHATASDGQGALDWLARYPRRANLVLMDVQMPGMDGIEATRRIRRQPPLRELPVIALTAGAFASQREAALEAGMSHFISKPFDIGAMVAVIRQAAWHWPEDSAPAQPPLAGSSPATATDLAADTDTGTDTGTDMDTDPDPVLDLARGLLLWSDADSYRRYLARFVTDYADAGATLRGQLALGERQAAAALAHKLAGVAAVLAMSGTQQLAQQLEAGLTGSGADNAPLLAGLEQQLRLVLAAIERFGAPDAPPSAAGAPPADSRMLLAELLAAFDLDTPELAETLLAERGACLPAGDLAALSALLANFDFRGAEQYIRHLVASPPVTPIVSEE